jgi:antitoxin ParD1/3/4
MQSIHISLPDPLTQFVDGQIAQGRDSSSSEYGRELIRVDEKRKAEDRMEEKWLEGLNRAESALTPAKLASPSYRSLGEVDGATDTALMPMVYPRVAARRDLVIYLEEQAGFNTVETMR